MERERELAEKYRDRARERRDGVNKDYEETELISTTANYRAVGPTAEAWVSSAVHRNPWTEQRQEIGFSSEPWSISHLTNWNVTQQEMLRGRKIINKNVLFKRIAINTPEHTSCASWGPFNLGDVCYVYGMFFKLFCSLVCLIDLCTLCYYLLSGTNRQQRRGVSWSRSPSSWVVTWSILTWWKGWILPCCRRSVSEDNVETVSGLKGLGAYAEAFL